MFSFGQKKKNSTKEVKLVGIKTEEKQLGQIETGFFEFRGEIYVKSAKSGAAKSITNLSKSFTDSIKELYPEEFEEGKPKDISLMKVTELYFIK